MQPSELRALFEPRGIAVVGASSNPDKLGFAMADSLRGYAGDVRLVNARPTPGMFDSIAAAAQGTELDLAVLCVPAAHTASAVRDSAAAGIRAALVCAGGFAEVGEAGLAAARAVDDAVRETGIRVLGPNTSGFFVPARGLFASFVPGVRGLDAGSVAVVAASGGINHVLSFQLQEEGAGVSLGVGIGAGQDLTAVEILRYLETHEASRAVILHLETVPDGRALLAAVARLSAIKPVVALVVGRNDVSEFAQSHTGALATSWRTTRAVLRQAGAVLVDTEEQAVAAATALAGGRAQAARTVGIGLVTAQAGPGLLIADALTGTDELPRLSAETQATIAQLLPPLTFQANPVDTGRPGPGFDRVIAATAADPAIGALGVYAITEPVVDLVAAVTAAAVPADIPVLLGIDGPTETVQPTRAAARAAGVTLLRGPSRLSRGLAAVAEDARLRAATAGAVSSGLPVAERLWSTPWDEVRGKELLAELGIRCPPRRVYADRVDARAALTDLTAPLVLKLVDAEVLHKSDIGGVVLGIRSPEQLDDALAGIAAAGGTVFLAEEMAAPGVELVLGARVDPAFGPIVLLGLGGTAAEVLADVAIRSAPLSESVAADMVDDLAGAALLHGHRGGPSIDRAELGRILARLGDIIAAGVLDEIEVNPLRLTADGLIALDAVVRPRAEPGAQPAAESAAPATPTAVPAHAHNEVRILT